MAPSLQQVFFAISTVCLSLSMSVNTASAQFPPGGPISVCSSTDTDRATVYSAACTVKLSCESRVPRGNGVSQIVTSSSVVYDAFCHVTVRTTAGCPGHTFSTLVPYELDPVTAFCATCSSAETCEVNATEGGSGIGVALGAAAPAPAAAIPMKGTGITPMQE